MRLLPVGAAKSSDWEDGLWFEKPGYPFSDCSWIHPPPSGHSVPEFEFEEGHDKNKNEPAPVFCVGTGNDCHVRLPGEELPARICSLRKEGRKWILEALLPNGRLYHGSRPLSSGQRAQLQDGDTFALAQPPTPLAFRFEASDEDNWYIDLKSDRDYPNKYPGRFPCRTSLRDAPEAPEELKRLAWQTDQMRRRSEEDQVRVADWSAFSQFVKRYYLKHGINCVPWSTHGRGVVPIDRKPQSFPPRSYPSWICELLQKERQLPGVDPQREMPFEKGLQISGFKVATHPGDSVGVRSVVSRAGSACERQPVLTPEASSRAEPLSERPQQLQHRGSLAPAESCQEERPQQLQHRGSLAPAESCQEPVAEASPWLRLPFREWLESMDESLFLMQYHDEIASNFDSLEQIHDIYVNAGEIGRTFFEDVGIKKLGHRRIFEKWFREHCA